MKIWKFYICIALLVLLLVWDCFLYITAVNDISEPIVIVVTALSAVATILLSIYLYRNVPSKKLFTSKNILQLILAVFAFITFNASYEIGNKYDYDTGIYYPVKGGDRQRDYNKPTDITSQSGFNGGALGMGIICASCVIGIVLIENKK